MSDDAASPIRIVIVDDHVMLAAALSAVLDATGRFSVVGVFPDAAQALAMLATSSVDVALVDLRLAGDDGIALVHSICGRWPAIAVLVVSGASDADSVRRAVDAG